MNSDNKEQEDNRLHPRNRNRERYDLTALVTSFPDLKKHIVINKGGEESVDFAKPAAVKSLNKAILHHYYGIKNWDFSDKNLCPPIPGRAEYIHHIADLLAEDNGDKIPKGDKITCLDVGTGASCIYPILGVVEYGWKFIASDIDTQSISSSKNIVNANPALKGKIICKVQKNPNNVFYDIIGKEEKVDLTICNPPFHATKAAANKGTQRKVKNLTGKDVKTPERNFSGISTELIYDGGEYGFIQNMIRESKKFAKNCYWFSTLVSKQSNLKAFYKSLEKFEAAEVKTIPMGIGNKSTRIIAWTFLDKEEKKEWRATKWKSEV